MVKEILVKNKIIGYTAGCWDLFHIGHLNILRNCKALCDKLVVGISKDKLVAFKHKKAVIPFEERIEIVRNIRFVDAVVPQDNFDRFEVWKKLNFNITFIGDDWYNNKKWMIIESKLKRVGVKVIYFPYTKGVSSTSIKQIIGYNEN